MTTTPQAALLSRMDAYLSGNSCEATAIIKDARELIDVLSNQIVTLMLAEEGAAEAFGVVVQGKRDLEAEVKRLQSLLEGAYASVRHHAKRANALGDIADQIIDDGHMNTELLARLRAASGRQE